MGYEKETQTHTVLSVMGRAIQLRFDLLDALPREDEPSEGMQHCLLAHALLSQVEHHLLIASMKGVK